MPIQANKHLNNQPWTKFQMQTQTDKIGKPWKCML